LFRNYVTNDFTFYTGVWYSAIRKDGFSVVGTDIANYTPPYLYLLYLTSAIFPDVTPVAAVKIPSIFFDFVCAIVVYLIVRIKYQRGSMPLLAFATVLMAPTVISNSGVWGQADSIYASMLLACVYYLMRGWAKMAMLAFGLAFAFKLQSIFLAPAILGLYLRHRIRTEHIMLIPGVYCLAMLPAWLAGRPAIELAAVYLKQTTKYHSLTMNAPSLYSWLPQSHYDSIVPLGLMLAGVALCLFGWLTWKSRVEITAEIVLSLCTFSMILMPFLLPKMHDRFFFPADLLTIAYAFFFPSQRLVAISVSFASFFAYQPFLIGREVVPLPVLSLIMCGALAATAIGLWRQLRASSPAPG
jgi:Gpi18-like mannosyltransferase